MKRFAFFRKLAVALAFIAVGGVSLVAVLPSSTQPAAAAGCQPPSIMFGRWKWCGYFYSQFDDVGPEVRIGGVPGSVDTVGDFYNLIWGDYNSGDAHKRTAAAFMVRTMIGAPLPTPPCAPGTCKGLTAADWFEFGTRLNGYASNGENGSQSFGPNGHIDWFRSEYMRCGDFNTYYQDAHDDIAPFIINSTNTPNCDNPGVRFDHIYIYDSSGNVIWRIRRLCMNPIGELQPLSSAPSFELTPSVVPTASSGGEGDQIIFNFYVANSGPGVSTAVACTPVGNNRAPGWSPLPEQDTARAPDAGYAPPGTSCPTAFNPGGPQLVATETVTLPNLSPGSKVCRSLVVDPKNTAGGPRTSAESCVTIAKTPYVRFMGNDVWAGGGFAAVNPACNTNAKITTSGRTLGSGAKAGSVGEYQAFALNQITSFGSAGHVLSQYGALGDISRMLTYANSEPTASRLGYYGAAAHCITDYTANYSSAPTIAPGSYSVTGRGSGAWRVLGNVTLNGVMPPGGQQVYYATGNVTINANLTYPAAYATLADIPSLVIITTGNIYVAPNVTQLDGVFVARGNGVANGVFYTCWPKNEPVFAGHPCDANQLTVNGAVAAARLDLLRSFGATGATDALRQAPGELFMFSPELYLRNALSTSSGATVETTTVLDLPPRF